VLKTDPTAHLFCLVYYRCQLYYGTPRALFFMDEPLEGKDYFLPSVFVGANTGFKHFYSYILPQPYYIYS